MYLSNYAHSVSYHNYCLITIHGFHTVQDDTHAINLVSSTEEPYLEEMLNYKSDYRINNCPSELNLIFCLVVEQHFDHQFCDGFLSLDNSSQQFQNRLKKKMAEKRSKILMLK